MLKYFLVDNNQQNKKKKRYSRQTDIFTIST